MLVDVYMRGDDGLNSHFTVMLLVPLIWLALYESSRWLYAGLLVTAGLLAGELSSLPPLDDALRVMVPAAIAVVVLPAVRHMVAVNRAALVAISEVANLDPLTGLANRRGLESRVHRGAGDHADGFGLIFVDLNRFKRVNDVHGHEVGDQLLIEVGRRLSATVRTQDVVARIGGDEFVIAGNTTRQTTAALAGRIGDAIAATPFRLATASIRITASVGYSHLSHRPDDTTDLLNEADRAMYEGKTDLATRSPQRP